MRRWCVWICCCCGSPKKCFVFSWIVFLFGIICLLILFNSLRTPTVTHHCGLHYECQAGQFAYWIKAGEGTNISPIICFNNNFIISPDADKKHGERGLNIVVFNNETFEVEYHKVFDTFVGDENLFKFMKLDIREGSIVLMASYDEMAENLSDLDKEWIRKYGSNLIGNIAYRDSFVMIGQRGLEIGRTDEMLVKKLKNQKFAKPAQIHGCTPVPIGPTQPVVISLAQVKSGERIMKGLKLENCGLKESCASDSFSVYIHSGHSDKTPPRICINGTFYIDSGVNDGGRGFNVILLDPLTFEVTQVGHFDTYEDDSMHLEKFLMDIPEGSIVVALAADESSRKLSINSRRLFQTMGSSQIQNLKFRDLWYFIGQVGLDGFAEIEEVGFTPSKNSWPPSLVLSGTCVNGRIPSLPIPPNPLSRPNYSRRNFCYRYHTYQEFCESENMDSPLEPSLLVDTKRENDLAFQVPMVVVPDFDLVMLRYTLETILYQPGIKQNAVYVVCNQAIYTECQHLVRLFGFIPVNITRFQGYEDKLLAVVNWASYNLQQTDYVYIIEDGCALAPDFLSYMHQIFANIVSHDDSVVAVGAFNDNSFSGLAHDPANLYRVSDFPSLAFALKRTFFMSVMKEMVRDCCFKRTWEGWKQLLSDRAVALIPEVSRVYCHVAQNQAFKGSTLSIYESLFTRERATNLVASVQLDTNSIATAESYLSHVQQAITAAKVLTYSAFTRCAINNGSILDKMNLVDGFNYSVVFNQKHVGDLTTLTNLTKCFGLFYVSSQEPRGVYRGLLRFSYNKNHMFLVGSLSPFLNRTTVTSSHSSVRIS